MSWEFTRDMIAPQDQQALDAFEDRRERCEAYYRFIKELPIDVKAILEIGVRCGYCARAMLDASLAWVKYIGIDKSDKWRPWWEHLTKGYQVAYVLADSRYILPFLGKREFDIVHIDGDHSAPGAAYDIRYAATLIHRQGVVIVDDAESEPVKQGLEESGILAPDSYFVQSTVSEVANTGQLSLAFTRK